MTRVYGEPKLESVYYDGEVSTDYFSGYVFRMDDGRTRLIYFGAHEASGRHVCMLAGRALVLEMRFEDGALWSLEGDFTNVSNTQAARYRAFGLLPQAWT